MEEYKVLVIGKILIGLMIKDIIFGNISLFLIFQLVKNEKEKRYFKKDTALFYLFSLQALPIIFSLTIFVEFFLTRYLY